MKNLILLSALFVSMLSFAQIATTDSGYTLMSFDYQGDSYLLAEYGPASNVYCLDGAVVKRVDVIGNVYTNGGGITRHLEIDTDRYDFVHQSYGQRVFDRIEEIQTVSNGVGDVSKFYMIVNGEPTLIADPDWAFCYQNDFREYVGPGNGASFVRNAVYYGTTWDGRGGSSVETDGLRVGLYDSVNGNYFRWETVVEDGENIYRLQLLSGTSDSVGNYIDVVYDESTGGVKRLRTYAGGSLTEDVYVSRAYTNWSYVTALVRRARTFN